MGHHRAVISLIVSLGGWHVALNAQPVTPIRGTVDLPRGEIVLRLMQAGMLRQVSVTAQGDVMVLEPVPPDAAFVRCVGTESPSGRTHVILSSPDERSDATRVVIATAWGTTACQSTGLWERELFSAVSDGLDSAMPTKAVAPSERAVGALAGLALGRSEAEDASTPGAPMYFLAGMLLGPIGVGMAYADASDHTPPPTAERVAAVTVARGDVFAASYLTAYRQRLEERRRASALGSSIGGWALSTLIAVLYLTERRRDAEDDVRRALQFARLPLLRVQF